MIELPEPKILERMCAKSPDGTGKHEQRTNPFKEKQNIDALKQDERTDVLKKNEEDKNIETQEQYGSTLNKIDLSKGVCGLIPPSSRPVFSSIKTQENAPFKRVVNENGRHPLPSSRPVFSNIDQQEAAPLDRSKNKDDSHPLPSSRRAFLDVGQEKIAPFERVVNKDSRPPLPSIRPAILNNDQEEITPLKRPVDKNGRHPLPSGRPVPLRVVPYDLSKRGVSNQSHSVSHTSRKRRQSKSTGNERKPRSIRPRVPAHSSSLPDLLPLSAHPIASSNGVGQETTDPKPKGSVREGMAPFPFHFPKYMGYDYHSNPNIPQPDVTAPGFVLPTSSPKTPQYPRIGAVANFVYDKVVSAATTPAKKPQESFEILSPPHTDDMENKDDISETLGKRT